MGGEVSPILLTEECEAGKQCGMQDGSCNKCGLRLLYPSTTELALIADRIDGGMPIGADELSDVQWIALGRWRRATNG